MEEYIEKAVMGFDGSRFLEGYYKGRSYLTKIIGDWFCLYSDAPISDRSECKDGRKYVTKIGIEDFEDLMRSKMYATYKGIEYEVEAVGPHMSDLILLARKGHEKEDLELGFEKDIDRFYITITKLVKPDEIESIRVERKSVYQEFYEEFKSKK